MGVGAIQRLLEKVQAKHIAQAEPVVNSSYSDDFWGHWPCTKETKWLPGKHSRNLCHGA